MYSLLLATLPTPIVGVIIVGATVLLALAGAVLVRRSVSLETLEAHTTVAGIIANIVGVVYAVLLALVVIAVWGQYENAEETASREANDISDLLRIARILPAQDGTALSQAVRSYANVVVNQEWPAMRRGDTRTAAASPALESIWQVFDRMDPRQARETSAYQEGLNRLTDLGNSRRERLLSNSTTLPAILWSVLVLGAAVTFAFTYVFGVKKLAAQMFITTLLALTIGLTLFLILVLDLPFTGGSAVPPQALLRVLTQAG